MPSVATAKNLCEDPPLQGMLKHAQSEYAAALLEHIRPGIDWLDIGCGRQVVPDWVWGPDEARALLGNTNLTGLDVDDAIDEHPLLKTRLRCLADDIPVADNSYDLVTANMVMEHVEDPARILREIRRVLRPDGTFLFHTPNRRYYIMWIGRYIPQSIKNRAIAWLEHREDKDIFPTLYKFNTPETVEQLARESGLRVESLRITMPTPHFLNTPFERLERPILALFERPGFERYRANLIVELKKPQQ